VLVNYIKAYQSNNVLTGRELWAFPIMLKLVLIEKTRYICEKIAKAQEQRRKVEEILKAFDENIENTTQLITAIDNELKGKYEVNSAFIEYLAYKFRKMGRAYTHVLRYIDERLGESGTTVDDITQKEHNEQTASKASIGNCIMSLKFISTVNWVDIFEQLSKVEQILREDPSGFYSLMDFDSRNYYRNRVEKLALKYKVSESHVAKKAVELARNAVENGNLTDKRLAHVGYYLVGKGICELEKEIGLEEWQKRPLGEVYPIVFIDAIHFSVKNDGIVGKKAVYIVLAIDIEGQKDVIGIYVGENESSKFWLSVLNDLKNRGVKDILILCADALSGIKDAINAAFPNTEYQRCIVHQIRNTLKYVSDKDRKEFARDLKRIYTAPNEKAGYDQMLEVSEKWEKKYPAAMKSWKSNWDVICPFFKYSEELRKIMYTTNTIESLNSSYRRINKSRTVFPGDQSLLKSIYLATVKITSKWTMRYKNWGLILGQLQIMFEGRI